MEMTLEAGKEMDRRCVMNWLIEICRNPTVAFNTHSDKQQIEYAHDAIVLLKEQEAKTGHWVSVDDGDVVAIDNDGFPERACSCSECKKYLIASDEYAVYGRYCPFCGVKMEGR